MIPDSFHSSGSFLFVEKIHFAVNDLSAMVLGADFAISLNSELKLKWVNLPSHQLSSSGGSKISSPFRFLSE